MLQNNLEKNFSKLFSKLSTVFYKKLLCLIFLCEIINIVLRNKYFQNIFINYF